MALAALTGPGWLFPTIPSPRSAMQLLSATNAAITMDAAGEKIAFIGRVWINGKPAGTKTLSAAGSGKIHFLTGTVVWANPETNVEIGIQDVALSGGPPHHPDGTFDVSRLIAPGSDAITSSAWHTITMSSGAKSIAHGDLLAVVFHMTFRAGSDVLRVQQAYGMQNADGALPEAMQYLTAWGPAQTPIVLIEFDDGTLATLDGTLPILNFPIEQFASTTNPDERGLIFQIPRTVKADAFYVWMAAQNGMADFNLKVYSDPLGTPTLLYSASIEGATIAHFSSTRVHVFTLPSGSEIPFTANTNYAIVLQAAADAYVSLQYFQFTDAAYRVFLSNGAQLRKGTRNDSTGPFAETTTLVPIIGFRVSHDDDGSGGGGGPIGGNMRGGFVNG